MGVRSRQNFQSPVIHSVDKRTGAVTPYEVYGQSGKDPTRLRVPPAARPSRAMSNRHGQPRPRALGGSIELRVRFSSLRLASGSRRQPRLVLSLVTRDVFGPDGRPQQRACSAEREIASERRTTAKYRLASPPNCDALEYQGPSCLEFLLLRNDEVHGSHLSTSDRLFVIFLGSAAITFRILSTYYSKLYSELLVASVHKPHTDQNKSLRF